MRKVAAKATLACGLLLSGASAPEVPLAPNAVISLDRQAEMRRSFNDLKRFWIAKGVGLRALKLEILMGNASAPCRPWVGRITAHMLNDAYCSEEKSIVVTSHETHWIDRQLAQFHVTDAHLVADVIVEAHEMGHAVQDAEGETNNISSFAQERAREWQADCMAGEAVNKLFPDIAHEALPFYRSLGSFPSHGTVQERFNHFEATQDGQIC